MTDDLKDLRKALDHVDRQLVSCLAERQRLVAGVAHTKAEGGGVVRDPQREQQLLTKLVGLGKDAGLDGFFVTRVFREILDHSLRRQHEHLAERDNPDRAAPSLVVAYQGGEGAYSHQAALKHFGARDADVRTQGYPSFKTLLAAVRDGEADYAVLPIENTTAGSINESYDLLAKMDLALVGEEVQEVVHCLIGAGDVPLSHIRRVYSHPQALAQCSELLESLPNCHAEAYRDTALAVGKIKEDRDLSQAAIASEVAAELYGLPVLKRDIANQKANYTRMVIVAREPARYDLRIPCKTSLILATKHEQGALARCIQVLADRGLSMTKLESRPRPNTPWEYLFYLDFEGNLEDPRVTEALLEVGKSTSFLKVLGSYPARTVKEARPAEPLPAGGARPARASEPAGLPADPAIIEALERKPYRLASRRHRAEDTRVPVGDALFGGERPVFVIGPSVVESRAQIRACARFAKEHGAQILRGGCYRPATSPQGFAGLGDEGLILLEEAGREVGLPVLTEVVRPDDVERIARRADALLVGSRSMQNFALLEAVGKVDRPVVLKRGLDATVDDWLEAAEFVLAKGNQQVVLCERGIRTFDPETRATLDLAAVPIVRERTHLPVVVDPSRALGVRRWVPSLARAALAAGAQGVLLEVHPEPAAASVDGAQALSFDEAAALLESL